MKPLPKPKESKAINRLVLAGLFFPHALIFGYIGIYSALAASDRTHDYQGNIDGKKVTRHRLRSVDWPSSPWDQLKVTNPDKSKTVYFDDEPFGSLDMVKEYDPQGKQAPCQGKHDDSIGIIYCQDSVKPQHHQKFQRLTQRINLELRQRKFQNYHQKR